MPCFFVSSYIIGHNESWVTASVNNNFHHFKTDESFGFLKCPYYGLWKVHILVLGVTNNRLTCMQDQKTLSFSYNMHLFLPYLLNDSQTIRSTIHFSKPLLCVTLICGDWSISFKAVFVIVSSADLCTAVTGETDIFKLQQHLVVTSGRAIC